MAVDPATIIALATTVSSGIASSRAQSRSTATQQQAIQRSSFQEQLASEERTKARTDQLDAILSSQTASAAARGIAFASPSFQAIRKSSLNAFAQDQFAENFNLSERERLFEDQKQDLSERNRLRLFTDIFTTTSTLADSFSFNTAFGGKSGDDLDGLT